MHLHAPSKYARSRDSIGQRAHLAEFIMLASARRGRIPERRSTIAYARSSGALWNIGNRWALPPHCPTNCAWNCNAPCQCSFSLRQHRQPELSVEFVPRDGGSAASKCAPQAVPVLDVRTLCFASRGPCDDENNGRRFPSRQFRRAWCDNSAGNQIL